MHNYYFKMEVTGRGRFPLDQLRRFEMFPIDVDTPVRIESSITGFAAPQAYMLGMYASALAADQPCAARFHSFGFTLETLEIWKHGRLFWSKAEGYDVTAA